MYKLTLTLLSLLLFTSLSYSQENIALKLNKLVDEYNARDLFSGTILVASKDGTLLEKAVGLSNLEEKIPNNPETVFNIGSIQKTFTRELLEILMKEGKLNSNDKLGNYITGFKDTRAEEATIEQIINMEGGFGDFIMIRDIQENAINYNTIDDYMDAIKSEPLLFAPGTDKR